MGERCGGETKNSRWKAAQVGKQLDEDGNIFSVAETAGAEQAFGSE